MKRWLMSVVVGMWFQWLVVPVVASEEITQFSSRIEINQDTSISIEETIDYRTDEAHHGIYRYIPIKYNQDGVLFTRKISQVKVTDGAGKNLPFTQKYEANNIELKIGDANITFTGKQLYRINYVVQRALNRLETADELYWDITGEGWMIPILRTEAIVESKYATINQSACYGGEYGGNDTKCLYQASPERTIFTYNETIDYGKNLTVVLELKRPNQLRFPSKYISFFISLKDNARLLLIPLPFLTIFFWWYKKGRDWVFDSANVFNVDPSEPSHLKKLWGERKIPFVYEPMQGITAGQAGVILDERADNQDVIAEIIDLARKKYLKIEEIEKKGLFFSGKDYQLTKLVKTEPLPQHQQELLDGLFKDREITTLTQLKGTFYITMDKVKRQITEDLTDKKLFTSNPTQAKAVGLVVAIGLNGLVFFLITPLATFLGGWPFVVLIVSGVMSLFFGWNMAQKTALGSNLKLQAEGLKRTINWGKWREEVKEKNLFIEEILPFAISLGVIKQLTRDMEGLNIKPPEYLEGSTVRGMVWSQMLSNFSQTASQSLAYNPSASKSSGGSGFSGGFSGGGGGGGGGGSW